MNRINVVLDYKLVSECHKVTGIQTKKDLIDFALKELLRHEEQKKILELKGVIKWEGNLSKMRKTSPHDIVRDFSLDRLHWEEK